MKTLDSKNQKYYFCYMLKILRIWKKLEKKIKKIETTEVKYKAPKKALFLLLALIQLSFVTVVESLDIWIKITYLNQT